MDLLESRNKLKDIIKKCEKLISHIDNVVELEKVVQMREWKVIVLNKLEKRFKKFKLETEKDGRFPALWFDQGLIVGLCQSSAEEYRGVRIARAYTWNEVYKVIEKGLHDNVKFIQLYIS
jgi:hypothetical protein